MAYDFTKLTAQQIHDYMMSNATAEQRKKFAEKAFTIRKKKVAIPVKDANGNPVMYQVKDKAGQPKLDNEGKPVMRAKLEYVEKENSKEEKVFSLLDAKWWFAENFPDAVKNVPKRAEKKAKAGDLFADWF